MEDIFALFRAQEQPWLKLSKSKAENLTIASVF